MGKTKKILIGIAIILIIFVGIGIGVIKIVNRNKKAMTASEFVTSMQSKGYIAQDAKSQFEEYEYIKQAYIASTRDYSYQIEFYQFSDENYAVMFYNTNKSIFEAEKNSEAVEKKIKGKNYLKYTLNSNGKYMLLSQIDNTVIYVEEDDENKGAINKIIKELGY